MSKSDVNENNADITVKKYNSGAAKEEKVMNTRRTFAVGIVLLIVLNLAGLIGLYCKVNTITDELNTTEYILFVGLNDKETRKQEIPDDVAITTVKSILAKYFDGYTLVNSQGVWTDGSGHEINENTVICYVSGVDEAAIYSAADELLEALDQYSILIKKNLAYSEYYEGKAD